MERRRSKGIAQWWNYYWTTLARLRGFPRDKSDGEGDRGIHVQRQSLLQVLCKSIVIMAVAANDVPKVGTVVRQGNGPDHLSIIARVMAWIAASMRLRPTGLAE